MQSGSVAANFDDSRLPKYEQQRVHRQQAGFRVTIVVAGTQTRRRAFACRSTRETAAIPHQ
jgi:hypothetical protein